MHPLKCYHLAASEMDLHKLFHGKSSERAKKGDRVLLIRTIQLTADLTVTCPVTFLMLPDIQFITEPFALRTAWEDDRSSAVLCFQSCSKAESVLYPQRAAARSSIRWHNSTTGKGQRGGRSTTPASALFLFRHRKLCTPFTTHEPCRLPTRQEKTL